MPSFIAPEQEIEFEVFCGKCGAGICMNCSEGKTPGRGMNTLTVEPCDKCLSNSHSEGYDIGQADGYEEAKKEFQNA